MLVAILWIATAVLAYSLEVIHMPSRASPRHSTINNFKLHQRDKVTSPQWDGVYRLTDERTRLSSSKVYYRKDDVDSLERIFQECQQNKVYFPAIAAASALLEDESIFLSSYQVSLIIKCFGAAAMVDDAINVIENLLPTKSIRQRAILSIVHYNAVLSVCKTHKRFQLAVDFFERMYDSSKQTTGFTTPEPDVVTITIMVACLCDLNRWEQALAIYKNYNLKNSVAAKNEKLVGSLLTGLKKCKQFNLCIELYEQYRGDASSLSIFLDNSMMNIYGELNRWQEALSIFNNMEKPSQPPNLRPDKISILTISSILRKSDQFEELRRIQKLYAQKRSDLDNNSENDTPPTYAMIPLNALLKEAQQFGKYEAARKGALEFLASPPKSWTPGGITTCIEIFGFIREPEMALQVLRVMVSKDKKPNTQHYNTAMNVCVRNGLYHDALDLFREMASRDQYSIGIALKAFNGLGQWREAVQLFETLQIGVAEEKLGGLRNPIQANTIIFNTMLDVLGSAKQWKEMFKLFNRLVMICNKQTQDSNVFVKNKIYIPDDRVNEIKRNRSSKNLSSGVITLDKYTKFAILDTLEKDQQYDMIAYLKSRWAVKQPQMEGKISLFEVVPSEVVDSLIIKKENVAIKELLPSYAESDCEIQSTPELVNENQLDGSKYKLLEGLDEVSSVMPTSEAGTLFEKLLENPNGSVVEVLRLAGRIDEALDIMDEMHKSGKKAHPSFYDAAIVACSPLGDWERAMTIFNKMKRNGVPLSSRGNQLLLHILNEFADPEVYESILISLNQSKSTTSTGTTNI